MYRNIVLALIIALMLLGCERRIMINTQINLSEIKTISYEKWECLSNKRIFFGHQSVGFNIIDGIRDIMLEIPVIRLNIQETENVADFEKPIFAHFSVGKNNDPISKCDDFRRIIENGLGDKLDIAFFKFCFVDIRKDTDIDQVFRHYVKTISYLESKYPKVRFVHSTVPLSIIQSGLKAKIKNFLGYPLWGEEDNIKRNLFSQMLIKKYGSKVFDLAKYESTYLNRSKSFFKREGKEYLYLVFGYTDDGDHLNSLGRRIIGKNLLLFLAEQQ